MNGSLKIALTIIAAVLGIYIVMHLVTGLLLALLPYAIGILAIYIVFNLATNRPILGGRRRILP